MTMRIFIGFDSTTSAAYWVQRASILHQAPDLEVIPINQQLLRMQGVYRRLHDPLASSEFTYTRFLVPYLCGYVGWALFMDGDMFVRRPIYTLGGFRDESKAVLCVHHHHRPLERTKMAVDGVSKPQTLYRRKNWSSLMLFNCFHPFTKRLTPEYVNEAAPHDLHQFTWAEDAVGELPLEFNWLEGWNTTEECPDPRIVHFTRGIPGIHDGCSGLPYAHEYLAMAQKLKAEHLA